MDLPPTLPPLPAAAAPSAADLELIKKASHAGRNLFVLACLATVAAVAFIALTFVAKELQGLMAVLTPTFVLLSAGYWTLTVAARRGNPNAVGVVIVAMIVQMSLGLILSAVTAAINGGSFQPNLGGLIIPGLVVAALISSRKVLLDLKERGLWDQVFGSAKPSGNLCLVGGVLLVMGLLAMNGSAYFVGAKAGAAKQAEVQNAKAFVQLIQVEEKEFLTAMQRITGDQRPRETDNALAKLQALEQKLVALETQAAKADRLQTVLTNYGNAVSQWKKGVSLMKEPNADMAKVEKLLDSGDKLRIEALKDFDVRYGPKAK